MKSVLALTAGLAAMTLATPALAGNADGKLQVKVLATGVLPDGAIDRVVSSTLVLPTGAQTEASDGYVPTVAVEYFLTPAFSIETICCITPHDVSGTGGLAGASLIDDAIILPATVTAKFHLDTGSALKPYIGAGATRFFIFGEGVDSTAQTLGVTSVNLSDEWGYVLQAGADVRLNDNGLGLSLDAKRYFVGTTATFRAGNNIALQTEHDLDPWVVSAGVTYRF